MVRVTSTQQKTLNIISQTLTKCGGLYQVPRAPRTAPSPTIKPNNLPIPNMSSVGQIPRTPQTSLSTPSSTPTPNMSSVGQIPRTPQAIPSTSSSVATPATPATPIKPTLWQRAKPFVRAVGPFAGGAALITTADRVGSNKTVGADMTTPATDIADAVGADAASATGAGAAGDVGDAGTGDAGTGDAGTGDTGTSTTRPASVEPDMLLDTLSGALPQSWQSTLNHLRKTYGNMGTTIGGGMGLLGILLLLKQLFGKSGGVAGKVTTYKPVLRRGIDGRFSVKSSQQVKLPAIADAFAHIDRK